MNLILKLLFASKNVREENEAHPSRVGLRGDQATANYFMSNQVAAMATRPLNNARQTFMHGHIEVFMPLYSSDATIIRGGTPVCIYDFVIVELRETHAKDPFQVPCRVVKVLFNVERQEVHVVLTCFRAAWGVDDVEPTQRGTRYKGLVRLFEELGPRSEKTLRSPNQVLDLVEVVTPQEASDGKLLRPCSGFERREGWSYVCEGFVRQVAHRFDRVDRRRSWRRAGGADETFPDMRAPDVNRNVDRLPFLSLTVSTSFNYFNVWGMKTAVRVEIYKK